MTEAEYRALPAVNWSTLKAMEQSPLHYRYALDNPRADSPTLAAGRLLHTLVLQPERFGLDYAVYDGDGTRSSREYKAWAAEHEGRTLFKRSEIGDIMNAAAALRAHPAAGEYVNDPHAVREHPVVWTDRATGLTCKARMDLALPHRRTLCEVKSSATIDPHRFGLVAGRMGYPKQAAHYAAAFEAAFGVPCERIVFLVVELDPPHDAGALLLDDLHRAQARRDVDALLARVAQCRRLNRWPGRYPAEHVMTLPDYLLDDLSDDPFTDPE